MKTWVDGTGFPVVASVTRPVIDPVWAVRSVAVKMRPAASAVMPAATALNRGDERAWNGMAPPRGNKGPMCRRTTTSRLKVPMIGKVVLDTNIQRFGELQPFL